MKKEIKKDIYNKIKNNMNKNQLNIDKIIQEVLNEEIDLKVSLIMEKLKGNQDKLDVAEPKGKLTKADFEKLRGSKKKETNEDSSVCEQCGKEMSEGQCNECGYGRMEEDDVEEGNAFSGALANAKKRGDEKFTVDGKTYPVKESKLKLTESELIDLIETVVLEQKKKKDLDIKVSNITSKVKDNIEKKYVSGLAKTEKSHFTPSKKENDDYISSVTKKMKDYLKDMGDSSFEMNPKSFPKGNGQKRDGDRVGYEATDAAKEYIANFTAAGLENLTYDEIHPDESWVDDNIEGSSRTGNNHSWANAVDTGIDKKRNQIRKDNLLGAVKQMAYNKAPQPVIDDMKKGAGTKFTKNFGKDSGKKATKILTQLESQEPKSIIEEEKKVIKELEKIKNLYSYNKKTQ